MHKILVILFLGGWVLTAYSYIPSYSLILSQMAKTQGRGAYRIEQNITLKPTSLSLTEIWWVDPKGLRLDVRSPQEKDLYLRFLYQGNKKIFRDPNNQIQQKKVSPFHLEWPFHLRDATKLKKLLSVWKAGPFSIPEREPGQASDDFLHLRRKGGKIQYEVSQGKAKVWIEQDEFVIQGWQWSQGDSLRATGYQIHPGRLFFPSERLLLYNTTQTGHIKVTKVQKLPPLKNRIHKRVLKKKNHLPATLSPFDKDRISTFYEKFR